MQDWDAVDAVETFIGFDSWHPTPGTRNTIERKSVGNLVFTGGRLTPAPSSPAQKHWHFAEPVGDQVVLEMPFSETVLVPVQPVKTGITPPLAIPFREQAGEKGPIRRAGRLHERQ
jgi:hypothetical protein